MAHMIDTLPIGADLKSKFAALRAEVQDRLARRKVYRRTLNELRNLSARELSDIGVAPSNIHSIAWQAAYEK